MTVNYLERVASEQIGGVGFSAEGGRATSTFVVSSAELEDAIVDILGTVEASGDGKLSRVLPKAHPRFTWLFADRITNIKGKGVGAKTVAETELEASPFSYFWQYPLYELTVEFLPLPYAVLSDSSIKRTALTYYVDAGTTTNTHYCDEWNRFTDVETTPSPEILSAQQGQYMFVRSGGSEPDGYTFSGMPRLVIPKSMVVITWFKVPYSYVDSDNSYLDSAIGRVNQSDWWGYPAGSLLYHGCSVKRYTPIVPERILQEGTVAFSINKICDITMTMEYTSRDITGAPTPANGSDIAAGHNAAPYLKDRNFYYVTSGGTGSTGPAMFKSFPFELLFTDPDA